jgi:hypothetical protein
VIYISSLDALVPNLEEAAASLLVPDLEKAATNLKKKLVAAFSRFGTSAKRRETYKSQLSDR